MSNPLKSSVRITAAWAAIEALKESELEFLFQELGFNKPELQLPIAASMARGLRDRLDLVKDQKTYTEQSLVMVSLKEQRFVAGDRRESDAVDQIEAELFRLTGDQRYDEDEP